MSFLRSITWFEWLIWIAAVVLGVFALAPADAFGAELDIAAYGGQPNGSNTSPALAAALNDACGGTNKTIRFGAGQYTFSTPPPVIQCGATLQGQGVWQTYLVRAYSESEFLLFRGALGGGLRDLVVYAAPGTQGGLGIHVHSSDSHGVSGNQIFQHVVISGEGTWLLPLFLDGSARTQAPAGIRTVVLVNVKVFNGTWWAVEWWNCVACEWYGGGAWAGHGSTQAIVIGGPLSTGNRVDAMIDWAASTVWPGSLR